MVKEDNYNIVYILSILNKVAPDKIKSAYEEIKSLGRDDAESVLKIKYLSKDKDTATLPIFKAKQTKDKIKIDINITGMDEAKILQINEAIKKMISNFE